MRVQNRRVTIPVTDETPTRLDEQTFEQAS